MAIRRLLIIMCRLHGAMIMVKEKARRRMRTASRRRPGLISPRPLLWDGAQRLQVPVYAKDSYPRAGDQLAQLLLQCYVVVGALYSRRDYQAAGGYRACRFAEDWDLWLRM